ncbi:LysR family transcriptional regulator [Denitromonas iodatirespirans]|uniref:LysR family transcriptional regulator n=1 Tax=Denitromonas iodatirespirans TaxID=2795389 RepID=A0A944H9J8_DENI1|nr:LysR family transcriptional regulator [Denitromonas iodatirespirans]MBT0963324.1 LysR family transcriptional regulator [Denitromonas iodatirespirans]
MDYVSLRAFVTVAREGNLTRAAQRLFVTQPALSLQLKKLQAGLELTLFERTPRGMRLTEAGQRLLPAAERALAAGAEFSAAAAGLKDTVVGRLRLGTIVDPEFLRLGTFLGALAERHPALSFELSHGMSGTVARRVEAGELDVAYTLGAPGFPELAGRFHVVGLTEFSYRVVAPPGWAGQVRGKGWRALAALPWIETPPESVHHRLLARIFAAEGVRPHVVARVDLEPSMLDLVRSGVALALARDSLALRAAHAEGVAMADAVSVPAELGFLCRRDRRTEAPIQAAMDVIEQVWRG